MLSFVNTGRGNVWKLIDIRCLSHHTFLWTHCEYLIQKFTIWMYFLFYIDVSLSHKKFEGLLEGVTFWQTVRLEGRKRRNFIFWIVWGKLHNPNKELCAHTKSQFSCTKIIIENCLRDSWGTLTYLYPNNELILTRTEQR